MDIWIDGRIDRLMYGWIYGWMDGWMDRLRNILLNMILTYLQLQKRGSQILTKILSLT